MKRFSVPLVVTFLLSCGLPSLDRSPLEFITFLRFFSRTQSANYSIGGAVSGLISEASVTLTNNNESVTIESDGNFTFPTRLNTGEAYNISLSTNSVSISCSLSNEQGIVQNRDIDNISVTCGFGADYYEVAVNVSGISGSLTVLNNSTDSLNISSTGLAKFSTRILTGSNYAVSISSQPAGSVCSFDDPTLSLGTISSSNVTIFITCITGYLVGGSIAPQASVDLGTSLISQNSYLRTRVGSYPVNAGGGGAIPGVAVAFASPTAARFNAPAMIATDGTFIYLADFLNGVIRKIDKSNGNTTILAGGGSGGGTICPGTITTNCLDGIGTAAEFNGIIGLTTNGNNLFVLESSGRRIRKVNLANSAVSTFAGSGNAAANDNASGILASFNNPSWITAFEDNLYIVDRGNCTIRVVNPITTAVSTIAGAATLCSFNDNPIGTNARFVSPLAVVALGTNLYITDIGAGGGHKIRRLSLSGTNAVTTIAGDGIQASTDGFGTSAQFNDPHGLATDGINLFISEWSGHRIRHLRISDNKVTTLVGSVSGYDDNTGGNGRLSFPGYILCDGANVYIVDSNNHSLRYLEVSQMLRYRFDGNTNDSNGSNHGIPTGAPLASSDENGSPNGSYLFDGSTEFIQSTNNILSSNINNLTISAWVNPSGGSGSQFIFYNGLGGSNGYGVSFDGSDRSLYISLGGIAASSNSTMKLPLNQWSHVVLTRNASNWQIYINGKPDSLVFAMNPNIPASSFKVADAGNGFFFKGKISDVRFFNGALDSDAIQRLAIQVPSGLVSFFPLDGNSKDYGNFNNDLVVSGAVVTSDRNGHTNAAYSFNGASFMQKLNPNGLPVGNNARSICAWFKTSNSIGQYIVGFGTMSASSGNGLVITSTVTGMFGVTDDVTIFHEGFMNQWIHLCGVYDSTTASIYENGVLRESVNKIWTTAISPNLEVGRLIDGTGNFFGVLDDIRIYNRVLSISEMKAIAGYYPTQVSSWNESLVSSSLKFYLMPEATSYGPGLCSGGINCVGTWDDRSGSGYHISQGVGVIQPLYNAIGINDVPAIRFIGTGLNPSFMSRSCEPILNGTTNTIVSVFKETTQLGNNGIFQNGGPTDGKLLYILRTFSGNPTLFDLDSNGAKVQSNSLFNSVNESVIMTLDYDGAIGNLFKNGAVASSIDSGGSTFNCASGNLDIGRYFFGGLYPGDGGYFDGELGDFIYFDEVLSTSDREIVQCYLSNKYNIPVSHSCP
ncbi:LamG-like jellyroll fold domain-containing protein [Leptospira sp. GIMC2001]|uniref:LamG-like jellyroll fold domain-containing protein n=1 Tax=Leptospira sp. GIMC2001 TaxID=1513297 RepID=UPI00234B21A6|nr:LamG-like jellyroll fold domain-containing protein [Leptospira sp. GIMC2001]WCL50527.1 concanavalin [Leptospira sp. GIMC2001]